MMGTFGRRGVVLGALFAAAPALAQSWPARPIRFVVPFAAGAGVLDIMARIVSQHLTEKLGQQVLVDNRPGAGGNVGAEIAAKATPDGYTMLMANTALVVSPFLYAKMSFDPLTDLVPVTMVNSAPLMLAVHPSLPATSVSEFVAYAKANPGKLNFGSGGVGTTPFLAAELLKSMASFDAVHVPYKGGAPALADLVAGQLSFMIENVPGTLPLVKDGKLRALGGQNKTRTPLLPDMPTMAEAGVSGAEANTFYGLVAPAGTPAAIVKKLNEALNQGLATEEMQKTITGLGSESKPNSPEEFATYIAAQNKIWIEVGKAAGVKID